MKRPGTGPEPVPRGVYPRPIRARPEDARRIARASQHPKGAASPRPPPPRDPLPSGPRHLTLEEVESARQQAERPDAELRALPALSGCVLITPQAEAAITKGIHEGKVRDFLYRWIGEKFHQPEAIGQLARWPRPNGAYRLYSPVFGGVDGNYNYLVHLILTDPLASGAPDAKVIVLAAEVIRFS